MDAKTDRPLDVCRYCHLTLDQHRGKDIKLVCIYDPMDVFELVEFYENRDTLRDWYAQVTK